MEWTKEQREAIELRNKNILVSAAAGSGKTAVLVERIKRLLIDEQVPLEEMLVVTFTNAAASEMREKIVSAISRAVGESGRKPEETAFLRSQLLHLHRANICTFHSFAMELIRRYFHLIQIEPNFRICDEAQKTIFKTQAMEDLFSWKFDEGDPDFLDFLERYGGSKNDDSVKQMILDAYEFIQSLPEPFEWLNRQSAQFEMGPEEFQKTEFYEELASVIMREIASALERTQKVASLLDREGVENLVPKANQDAQMLEDLQAAFRRSFDQGKAALEQLKFQTFVANKASKESYEAIKEVIQYLRDGAKDAIKRIRERYCTGTLGELLADMNQTSPSVHMLCRLVESFHGFYRDRKAAKGLLDFSDIEHYALDILSFPEAAEACRNKYRYIFIDEYQDSNLVQETLITRIKRPDNLFMVGDVKQSIYKFRLAEPQIFIHRYETFRRADPAGPDRKLDLNRNFRSKGPVIHVVNKVFELAMSRDSAGLEYDEAARLYQGVTVPSELEFPPALHLLDESQREQELDPELLEMKRVEMEASLAARLIQESRGKPYYDVKKGMVRPLENKDMVILLRSASGSGEVYAEALKEAGIPAYVDMGDGFFDTMEVSVFLNLLKVIDNKKQDIPLLSVLRSPIFDFTITELAEIRVFQRRGAFSKAFAALAWEGEGPLSEKCRRALERLSRYRLRSGFLPLEDFLWELLMETGYYSYVGAIPGGSQRQANLKALVDRGSQYQKNQGKGLFGFINYVEALKKQKVPTAQVKMVSESDDVVRIMTVHKSKGLEFPLVLLGNLGQRFRRDGGKGVSLHKDLGLALPLVDRRKACYRKTLLKTMIDDRRMQEELAEEIRILYVALTRPMDRLILLGTVKDLEKTWRLAGLRGGGDAMEARSYLDFLLPALWEDPLVEKRFHTRGETRRFCGEQRQRGDELKRKLKGGFDLEEDGDSQAVGSRLSFQYPYLSASKTKSKFSVSELTAPEKQEWEEYRRPLAVPVFCGEAKRFTGAEKGTILHKIMEHIPFTAQGKGEKEIKEFIRLLQTKEILTKEEAMAADAAKIAGFFASPLGKRACQADALYRETSFNLRIERAGEPLLVQGTIDCYFREKDRYILLDYKSNYVDGGGAGMDETAHRYFPQLQLYKEALERIRGIQVEEMYLYLFSAGKALRL